MKYKSLLFLMGLLIINGCDSGSNPAAPTDSTTYATIVSMAVSGVEDDFITNTSAQNTFKDNVAASIGLTSEEYDRVEILSISLSTFRAIDVDIKLNFLDSDTGLSASELIASTVELDEVGGYSVVAQEEEVVVDCNGIPDGDSVEDCNGLCDGSAELDECGVCDGSGHSCTIKGIWKNKQRLARR